MKKPLNDLLSKSAKSMKASEIRELLKLLSKPEMISFAGGLPNPAAFPIEQLKPIMAHVMEKHAAEALQYGVTEGHNKLRDAIARGMDTQYGVPQDMHNILITTGSQQALNLISQVFINPGDLVLTENPTYLAAVLSFRSFQAQVEGVAMDENGLCVDQLEEKLVRLRQRKEMPKIIYVIPNFQNPTGVTMAADRRVRLYQLLREFDLLLVEDDPYGLLRFEGETVPLVKSLDVEDRVIYLGSFSKILAPGFRTGWLAAPKEIVNRVSMAKQAQDLCSNTFSQYCIYEAIHHNILFPHVAEIVTLYRHKRDFMINAMKTYFPEGVKWSYPQGGLFTWVTLPAGISTLDMLPLAIENNVAYVTGAPFFPAGGGENTMRLNYSYASDEQIEEGIKRLGKVISQQVQDQNQTLLAEEKVDIF
jgi:2-aminoadipate transaminase